VNVSRSPLEAVVLGSSAIELTVLPAVGARLHRLRAFGHDLLRTPDDAGRYDDEPFFWGAYPMIPWCNRLSSGPVDVAGRRVELPANFRDGSAIHGQLYAAPWQWDEGAAMFSATGGGAGGWPWRYLATMRLAVTARTLVVEQTLYNLSPDAMPAGLGLHPWFRKPVRVRVAGDLVFDSNEDSSPVPQPVDGRLDLRRLDEMAPDLDATWARLGDPPIELYWPDTGVEAVIRFDARSTYVTAASPADIDAVAVEPQTHAPQGLRRLLNDEPGALDLLQPADDDGGGSLSLTIQMTFNQRTVEDDR
jgi:aldose 1-epimerase